MVTVNHIAAAFEARRHALGMTKAALAMRSGVSIATVKRILSGRSDGVAFGLVARVAETLGLTIDAREVLQTEAMLDRRSQQKAEQLAALTQATSSLESQGLDRSNYDRLMRDYTHRFRADSKRKLWSSS